VCHISLRTLPLPCPALQVVEIEAGLVEDMVMQQIVPALQRARADASYSPPPHAAPAAATDAPAPSPVTESTAAVLTGILLELERGLLALKRNLDAIHAKEDLVG
jgi:hypothetical protein